MIMLCFFYFIYNKKQQTNIEMNDRMRRFCAARCRWLTPVRTPTARKFTNLDRPLVFVIVFLKLVSNVWAA